MCIFIIQCNLFVSSIFIIILISLNIFILFKIIFQLNIDSILIKIFINKTNNSYTIFIKAHIFRLSHHSSLKFQFYKIIIHPRTCLIFQSCTFYSQVSCTIHLFNLSNPNCCIYLNTSLMDNHIFESKRNIHIYIYMCICIGND